MSTLSIHNIKSVHVSGTTHDGFCTLKLQVCTQHKSDKQPIYENVELYFNDVEDRQAFIETIAFQYEGN
jgi:hypothetical protein